jgi:1,4-dihydroxy-2-naphthoate octaprenyltransferase
MLKILIVLAIVSLITDMSYASAEERKHAWIESAAIISAVFIVSFVGAWNDYKKEG